MHPDADDALTVLSGFIQPEGNALPCWCCGTAAGHLQGGRNAVRASGDGKLVIS